MSKEAYIKSVDVAGLLCNVEYATVNGLETQYDVDLKYIYGRPKKSDGSSYEGLNTEEIIKLKPKHGLQTIYEEDGKDESPKRKKSDEEDDN